MKILLTAINAKYIHSNLAVYSLRAYAKEMQEHIVLAEYTMNHRTDFILQELYKQKPDVLMFSCYIWNFAQIRELVVELKKLMPQLPIWVGGPEVSYECESFLKEYPMVTGIMRGEGEETFRQLCEYYVKGNRELSEISGIVYYNEEQELIVTPEREMLSMDELPFCYENLEDFTNRIIYYETSRGCPFRCSYCLSSIEKNLRFRSLSLVYRELSFFLEHKVPQVKFVDRTFNCNHEHAMAIWKFLKEHDNGITNFHFEISADLLWDEEMEFLSGLRPGLVQLEIGVQSTNPKTIQEIRRSMDLERLEQVVRTIQKHENIHQHLDLIAGLPFEDYESFQQSFDRMYRLYSEQLQLGFLKVLKGSYMYEKRKEYEILYHTEPPYEVLATKWLSYEEVLKIKLVEEMLEVYYNSGQYEITVQLLEKLFDSPFSMYLSLGEFYEKQGLFFMNHSRIRRCEILLEFLKDRKTEGIELFEEALTFDLYYRENMKSRPRWATDVSFFKQQCKAICGKQKNVHLEAFHYDFTELLQKKRPEFPKREEEWNYYLFSYEERNSLTNQAKVIRIERKEILDDKTNQRDFE